jgi:uroporphyrinogen-III synthase
MLPLHNKRILLTRPRHQASELAFELKALGAIPILIPTIEIISPETYAPLDTALAQLNQYDWIIFTSANAVEIFSQRIHRVLHPSQSHGEGWDIRATREPLSPPQPILPRIAVIGPATAKAVQGVGLPVDLIPAKYIAESLAEALTPYAANANMLIIRAEQARDILPEALTAAGATVTFANAYRNQIPPDSIPALQKLFSNPGTYPDAITFTSTSTARNLVALLETADLTLPTGIALASIGPITSQTLRDLGHQPTVEAPEPTIPALIQSLLRHFSQST